MALGIVGAAFKHARKPVFTVARPGPVARMREPGILPIAVASAARILSEIPGGHCAGSSAMTSRGASPCARAGSLPMHRTRAPVGRYSTVATFAESCRRQSLRTVRSWPSSSRNARTCSKTIRPWANEDATHTTSARRIARGPATQAVAIAAVRVDFPAPRATDKAQSPSVPAKPARNLRCHGSSRIGSPAPAPCVIVRLRM